MKGKVSRQLKAKEYHKVIPHNKPHTRNLLGETRGRCLYFIRNSRELSRRRTFIGFLGRRRFPAWGSVIFQTQGLVGLGLRDWWVFKFRDWRIWWVVKPKRGHRHFTLHPVQAWGSGPVGRVTPGVHKTMGLISITTYPRCGGARLSTQHLGVRGRRMGTLRLSQLHREFKASLTP